MRVYFESHVGIGADMNIRPRAISVARESDALPEEIRDHILRISGDEDTLLSIVLSTAELDALADGIDACRKHVKEAEP